MTRLPPGRGPVAAGHGGRPTSGSSSNRAGGPAIDRVEAALPGRVEAWRRRLARRIPAPTRRCAGWPNDARARPAPHDRRGRQPARAAWPAGTCPPGRAARRAAAPPTSCRPAATSTRSTRRRSRRRWRGRWARRWPTGSSSVTSPRPAGTRPPSASCCGAPPPCAPPATTSPRRWPCSASGPAGTSRASGSPASRSIPLAELGRPRIDVTLRISGFFRDAFPHARRTCSTTRSRLVGGARRGRRDQPGAGGGHRRPAALGTAAGRLRVGHPGRAGAGLVAHRRRPRRGVPRVVGVRVRPRAARRRRPRRHAPPVRRHRGRGQEPGQPRARHLRLRRLPPGPRRHGRGRPGAHRRRRRRRGSATRPIPPDPKVRSLRGGGGPGGAQPGAEPASGSTRCAATATRARSSWPPPSTTCSATTPPPHVVEDWMYERVTDGLRRRPEQIRKFFERSNPWALRRSPSGCSRPTTAACGTPRDAARSTLRAAVLEAEGWEEPR